MTRQQIKEFMNNIKYHYFNVEGGGSVCVGSAVNKDLKLVVFAAAYQSPKDKFTKEKGRFVVNKRIYHLLKNSDKEPLGAHNTYSYSTEFPSNKNIHNTARNYVVSHIKYGWVPNWLERRFRRDKSYLSEKITPRKQLKIQKERE